MNVKKNWTGPLSDLKIIDLTRVLSGPFVTQLLGDQGAEIIKIEPPDGDDTRKFPPFINGESHYFFAPNRNKKSIGLDLKKPEAIAILKKLITNADILVENYRPGVMDKLGLSYKTLSTINPKLIYCSISGFGMDGPLRDAPSFDAITQALTGAMSINGDPTHSPSKIGLPIGDLVAGVFAPIGILSALHERSLTGKGRLIDISLYDGLIGMLEVLAQLVFITDKNPNRVGSAHQNIVPYNTFDTLDGPIIIAALTDRFWFNLCDALDAEDLKNNSLYNSNLGRAEHRKFIEDSISKILILKPTSYWINKLKKHDVPHAPVLGIKEALQHPHAIARNMVVTANHSKAGLIKMIGRSIKFPGSEQEPLKAPPVFGEHTVEILTEILGLSNSEILNLEKIGAIFSNQKKEF